MGIEALDLTQAPTAPFFLRSQSVTARALRTEKRHATLRALKTIAPAGYHVTLHIHLATPMMQFRTWPETWAKFYDRNSFALRDPVIAWGISTTGACRWSALPVPDPFGIMQDAARHGLTYGVTVSHGPITSRSIVSAAHGTREFTDDEIDTISAIVKQLHEMATPPEHLSKAQKDALHCIARGDRYAAAAAKLGISEGAFKSRLRSVRARLMARTTTEALQRVHEYRLL